MPRNPCTTLPVSEHLEEGVVVEVLPHVIEVVVLASRADTLLGVCGLGQLRQRQSRVRSSQEERLKLHNAIDTEKLRPRRYTRLGINTFARTSLWYRQNCCVPLITNTDRYGIALVAMSGCAL